jgi:hypothetical protein
VVERKSWSLSLPELMVSVTVAEITYASPYLILYIVSRHKDQWLVRVSEKHATCSTQTFDFSY